ncbi:hypothetical protein AM328_005120 [Escherichia coli]|nr:hypothetical protein AM328_005120 [Escherichia coli]
MRKYIPLVLFIFSWPVLCADIHGRLFVYWTVIHRGHGLTEGSADQADKY